MQIFLLRTTLAQLALLLIGVFLFVDSTYLMAQNNFSFGVTLPFGISIFLICAGLKWHPLHAWLRQKETRKRLWVAGWSIAALWLTSVAAFFYFIQAGHDTDIKRVQGSVKSIVVLGAGSDHCGTTPTLAARLDLGYLWAQQFPAARVIVSGGQDFGEQCTEAQVMGDYLIAKGLPASRILREDRSTNTYENFIFSKQLMTQNGIHTHDGLLIVTSDFHSVRSRQIALKAGFDNIASAGADTPLGVRYNSWLREYFSFIKGWLLGEY